MKSPFSFEYCDWIHNGQICQFEWKRATDSVQKQACNGLDPRVTYTGNYDNHECEIEISKVSAEDNGTWTCDIESYVWGPGRGYKVQKNLVVAVKQPSGTNIWF